MSSVTTFDGPNGREFVIEIKVRQPNDELRSALPAAGGRVQEFADEDSANWYDSQYFPRQSRIEPLEAVSPYRSTDLGSPDASESSSVRRANDLYRDRAGVERRPSRFTVYPGIRRAESRASRLSRRLSRANEVFYDAFEFQGWGDQRLALNRNGSLRRIDSIELIGSPVPDSDGTSKPPPQEVSQTQRYGPRMAAVMVALCVTNLLVALEGTVTSTALPTIVKDLGGGEQYVWASSGYFLTSTVFQPLYGQMANIFGRRWLMIYAVAMFLLGSGISGGAPSMGVLIFGRIVQGVGGGGINMLVNLIVCDLVPLRDRGRFMAIIFGAISVGTSLGPFLGGVIVQQTSWRWVFYLNIPIGCVSIVLLLIFLQVGHKKDNALKERLKRIDVGGNVIFITSVSFILIALTYGGTIWPWGSYSTIVSLVLGFFGLAVFGLYEESNYCVEPTIPLRLFTNRTSATAFAITFIHSLLTLLVIYFLPVYFQGVLLSSPIRSGVQMLPTVIVLVPFSAVSGSLLSKFGRYKPFHFGGFAFLTIGLGCFITLDATSPDAAWIMVQLIVAVGSGFSLSTLLPAAQAEFSDKDTAAATATWAFIRQFGVVWGVSVPAAIFNARFEHLLPRISDSAVREELAGGAAYEHGTKQFVGSFTGELRQQIISVYSDSLKVVWIFATALAGLGFLLVFLEREIVLRTELDTEYGLKDNSRPDKATNKARRTVSLAGKERESV